MIIIIFCRGLDIRVAQIVKTDMRHTQIIKQLSKLRRYPRRGDRRTVRLRYNKVIVVVWFPVLFCLFALRFLYGKRSAASLDFLMYVSSSGAFNSSSVNCSLEDFVCAVASSCAFRPLFYLPFGCAAHRYAQKRARRWRCPALGQAPAHGAATCRTIGG